MEKNLKKHNCLRFEPKRMGIICLRCENEYFNVEWEIHEGEEWNLKEGVKDVAIYFKCLTCGNMERLA